MTNKIYVDFYQNAWQNRNLYSNTAAPGAGMGTLSQQDGSRLADILGMCFDGSKLMTRDQWATCLNVTLPSISQWVAGKNVPRPETLIAVIEQLQQHCDLGAVRLLEQFEAIASSPAGVSAPKLRGAASLNEYLLDPILQRLRPEVARVGAVQRLNWLRDALKQLSAIAASKPTNREPVSEDRPLSESSIRYLIDSRLHSSGSEALGMAREMQFRLGHRWRFHTDIQNALRDKFPAWTMRATACTLFLVGRDSPVISTTFAGEKETAETGVFKAAMPEDPGEAYAVPANRHCFYRKSAA
jgi:hypothetical protein